MESWHIIGLVIVVILLVIVYLARKESFVGDLSSEKQLLLVNTFNEKLSGTWQNAAGTKNKYKITAERDNYFFTVHHNTNSGGGVSMRGVSDMGEWWIGKHTVFTFSGDTMTTKPHGNDTAVPETWTRIDTNPKNPVMTEKEIAPVIEKQKEAKAKQIAQAAANVKRVENQKKRDAAISVRLAKEQAGQQAANVAYKKSEAKKAAFDKLSYADKQKAVKKEWDAKSAEKQTAEINRMVAELKRLETRLGWDAWMKMVVSGVDPRFTTIKTWVSLAPPMQKVFKELLPDKHHAAFFANIPNDHAATKAAAEKAATAKIVAAKAAKAAAAQSVANASTAKSGRQASAVISAQVAAEQVAAKAARRKVNDAVATAKAAAQQVAAEQAVKKKVAAKPPTSKPPTSKPPTSKPPTSKPPLVRSNNSYRNLWGLMGSTQAKSIQPAKKSWYQGWF
jgi:hypothetical protein